MGDDSLTKNCHGRIVRVVQALPRNIPNDKRVRYFFLITPKRGAEATSWGTAVFEGGSPVGRLVIGEGSETGIGSEHKAEM